MKFFINLKVAVLSLFTVLLHLSSTAQPVTSINANTIVTASSCSAAGGYTYDGYVLLAESFPAPYTLASVTNAISGMPMPAATIVGDTLKLQNLTTKTSAYPTTNVSVIIEDGAGNTDTVRVVSYSVAPNLRHINEGYYSYCDSVLRIPIPYDVAGGITNVTFSRYIWPAGWTTIPNTVTVTEDSIYISNTYPEGGAFNYQLTFSDTCGASYSPSVYMYLDYFNDNVKDYGDYVCDQQGLQGAVIYPEFDPPYTLLEYSHDSLFKETGMPAPEVVLAGDSIVFNNMLPYTYYNFRFAADCDTFNIRYQVNPYESTHVNIRAQMAAKTCDTVHSAYVSFPGAGNLYDATIADEWYETDAVLTTTAYGDSLVISGFPNLQHGYYISLRDTVCHNTKYVFYSAFENFSTPDNPNYQNITSSVCDGQGTKLQIVPSGLPPYTFTQLQGPSTIEFTQSGDTVRFSNLVNQPIYAGNLVYSFAVTDACGISDTFELSDYDLLLGGFLNPVYEAGGCSGSNSAAAYLKLEYLDSRLHPTPYFNGIVTGPGSPTITMDGALVKLGNLNPETQYQLQFEDSCGYVFSFNYTSLPANSDVLVTPSTVIQGHCIDMDHLEGNFAIRAAIKGINYPYTAYLQGDSSSDTLYNLSIDTITFSGLNAGTYDIVTIDVCNNINTQTYTIETPQLQSFVTAASYFLKNCDTIGIPFNRYKYFHGSGIIDESTFNGPYTAFVVRAGGDTVWAHSTDTAKRTSAGYFNNYVDTMYFPIWNNYEYNTVFGFIDGCGDTLSNYIYYGLYNSYTKKCVGGEMFNAHTFSPGSYQQFVYPLYLNFSSGNIASDTIRIEDENDFANWNIYPGQYANYTVTDTCGNELGSIYLSGPTGIYANYQTRFCGVTDGKHKGNADIWVHYTTNLDSIRYTKISGPGPDTVITSRWNVLSLRNVDTGTYVFEIEELNSCASSYTLTFRVEPFIDSISSVFVSGCLNANKLVTQYYSNRYSADYNTLTPESAVIYIHSYDGIFGREGNSGDTIFNVPSSKTLYLTTSTGCGRDTIVSPAYLGPRIKASAGFTCTDGFSLSILGDRGVPPYTYEILSGFPTAYSAPEQTSNVFTGLPAVSGNVYQVRLKDQCGNAFTTLARADSVNNPLFSSGFACVGSNYTAYVDSIPNVTYQWTGPAGFVHNGRSFAINPVTEADTGTYTLTLTNTITGCTSVVGHNVAIIECALSVGGDVTNILCYGDNTGSIDATGYGGNAPYSFLWSNGATTEDLSGLTAGTYTVTITDANAEEAIVSFEITQIDSIALSATKADLTCNGVASGTIDLTIAGGTAPYEISWSNSVFTEDQTGIAAGSYTVTVVDANNCSKQLTVTLTEPEALTITNIVEPVSCFGVSNGAINVTISGGVAPYTYNWSNGETTQDIADVAAGTYSVIVTDANGCTLVSENIEVTSPDAIAATVDVTATSCGLSADGAITVTPTGGTAPATYLWDNGAVTNELTAIPAGTYEVIITDANGCTHVITETVIAGNCVPVALNDTFVTSINTPVNNTVVQNDTASGDGGNTWALDGTNGGAANGTVTMGSDGGFTYTPNTGFIGEDSFTYNLCDANGDCSTAVVFITIDEPTPVTLIDFSGRAQDDCTVALQWITGEERNFDKFIVEVSKDGSNFSAAGSIAAQGSNSRYHFIYANDGNDMLYFRLKMVDLDASIDYSNVLPISVACNSQRSIKVYPTLTKGTVTIEGLRTAEGITLYDGAGRLLLRKNADAEKESINIADYASGMYYIFVTTDDGEIQQFKVIRE